MKTPGRIIAFLAVGLVAASQSGNIIRIGDAHPVAIAAWRLVIASIILAPLAGRQLRQLAALSVRQMALLFLAGAVLAAHFFTWIAAVQLTTVANAAMVFAINPVLTATAAHLVFGESITKSLILSVIIGIAGAFVIGLGDFALTPEHLTGDLWALVCSALFTVYFLLGKSLRQKLSNRVYVTSLYGAAALFSFAALSALDLPYVDYSAQTWLCFVLMALVPTLLGHTSMNAALKYIDAGKISAATLTEPAMAGVVAYFAWGEELSIQAAFGYALICVSVAVLIVGEAQARRCDRSTRRDSIKRQRHTGEVDGTSDFN